MYTKDLVKGLQVDMNARVAIMRKGGLVRLTDYTGRSGIPPTVTLGLYWDVTDGVNIDLDASVIMFDANLKQLDIVYYGKLGSSDGAIKHGGDEREGDEKGVRDPSPHRSIAPRRPRRHPRGVA
jgi:stress response protein SCP2